MVGGAPIRGNWLVNGWRMGSNLRQLVTMYVLGIWLEEWLQLEATGDNVHVVCRWLEEGLQLEATGEFTW